MGGYKYFITFIDYFSCYGHVELIHEKSNSLKAFNVFKAKMKLQKGKLLKAINANRGSKYYRR